MIKKKELVFSIIPVKRFEIAKSRLGNLISDNERKKLCQSMLEDVLQTITSMKEIQVSAVVSNDMTVRQVSEKFKVNYLEETKKRVKYSRF